MTMAKLDFSSLKTADLRSVAPVDESAIPRPQQPSDSVGAVSSGVQAEPVSSPVASVPAHPVHAVAVSEPAAPVAKVPVHAVHASKKISLTGLKTGGTPFSSAPAPAPVVAEAPKTIAPALAPKRTGAMISLGTKPAVSLVKKEETEAPAVETVVAETEAPAEQSSDDADRPLVEGVDIIQAAKVIGTEGEAKANEILTESLKDPEAAKKEAEEKAVAAIVIPETEKVFFPNLEMDDDFFDDPLFEGIVPPKPDKKPEVRQPIEMKKEEAVAEAVAAETVPEETVTTTEEAPATIQEEVRSEVSTEAVVETAVADVPEETVAAEAVALVPKEEEGVAGTVAETEEAPLETPVEAYVESVAKDLSAERKGGLSKLFGERKVLVRAMAGFFAVAVLGVGAFSFVSPSIKTSGPEAMNTGSELPKYVPSGETKVVGEGVRVFTGRRPNVQKNKKPLPVTGSGAATPSSAVSASGADVGSGSTASGASLTEAPSTVSGATAETLTGSVGPEQAPPVSPVPQDLPVVTGAAEAPQPTEVPAP